jgi:hypothetical protein
MKTLADFKRSLIVGSKWLVCNGRMQRIQTVLRVQSNAVVFLREPGVESWLHFPKASEFGINSNGEAEIYYREDLLNYQPREVALKYSKIK